MLQIKKNPDFALGGKSIRALDGFFTGIGFALPQSKRQYFSWYKEFQEIKFLIPELLEWLQDYNWPVADEVLQVLLQRENLVVPYVKEILEGPVDVNWFIWLMDLLIPTFTKEHKEEFREILYKMKNMEVIDEDTEDLAEEAEKCWERCFD